MKRLFLIAICIGLTTLLHAQEFKGRSNDIQVKIGMTSTGSGTQIVWLLPERNNMQTDKASYRVKAGIKLDGNISEISFYRNGMKEVGRGFTIEDETSRDYDRLFQQDITLVQGQNDLALSVKNESGQIFSASRTVIYNPADLEDGIVRRDFALLFGTDEYHDWDNLINPVNDTKTLAKELKEVYGFETDVVLNPTVEEVMGKLREYAMKSYLDNDQFLIFFAGHGQFDEIFGEGYIVCKDSKLSDQSKNTYISHVRLRNIINNIPCKHTFLVIDACFGGTFDPLIARADVRGGNDALYGEISKGEFIKRKLQFRTRRYLTSGGKIYVPDGRPGHHSPFTRKMLEALRNYGGSDQILTLSEVLIYVEKLNPEPRFGEFGDNEPGSDFVFVVK
ncbi:caspase domain-containing protein [Bacteroidota bacterium]